MLTLKFGGTSMADAECISASAKIIIGRAEKDRVSVIASAASGVSNFLQDSIDSCIKGESVEKFVQELKQKHYSICNSLVKLHPDFNIQRVLDKIDGIFTEYEKLLNGVVAFSECPDTIYCRIMGMGELLSNPILEEVLKSEKQNAILLDTRDFIVTTGNQKEGDPDYSVCTENFLPYRDGESFSKYRILIFPGFVCSWIGGNGKKAVPGLLGRNGSDFSASIVASSLSSSRVEFWTDVDGVYTADPRIVKDAILVDDMTYEESMELAFFGSKVLHPKTLAPLVSKGIEAWSLNSHNPSSRGTRIGKGPFDSSRKHSICGISCLKKVSMISVSGNGMRGRSGMASRIFASVSSAGISILLITQSSSEYTISFCVKDEQAYKVQDVLEAELSLEIRDGLINPVQVKKDCAVVSVVGDGMISNRGIAAKFLDAISSQDINILAIAQGSSERCISAVISGCDGDTAVRAIHAFFFNTSQTIEVFAFGAGTIGGTLLDQIKNQQKKFLESNIDLKVICIATGHKLLLDENGLDLSDWRKKLSESEKVPKLDDILKFVQEKKYLNPVFVDCTASYDLPERYLDILNSGMSIATPNKRANSMKYQYYKELRHSANKMHRRFLYETNVGAGLPIIDTLQNLFKSGDKLKAFSGIMSGSLSYIFGKLDEGVLFSDAVIGARNLGFTEPDPRDDLSGMDVARKALIIARESGMEIELEDIKINRLFPDDFDDSGKVEQFLSNLPKVDKYFEEKIKALKKEDKVLRMGASIEDGKVSVGLLEVSKDNPLYGVKGGENAFVFTTDRYNPIPLTVRGYGAGAEVTAAGVFGDILRTVSFNGVL